MLKISLAQVNPTVGDFSGNLSLIREGAQRAIADQADIVVFPELALTGYYPGDLFDDRAFTQRVASAAEELLALSSKLPAELYLVVGVPVFREIPGGKPWRNELWVLNQGKLLNSYAKQLLPTYNIFDERRHFEPGPDTACVRRIKGVRLGFLICEDGWNSEGTEYAVNPFQRLQDSAVDLVVSINASPADAEKQRQREAVFTTASKKHGLPIVYVNQVGGQDSLVFDGASFLVSVDTGVVSRMPSYESAQATFQFDENTGQFYSKTGGALPEVPSPLSRMEAYRRQIVLGLQDYARRCGFTKAVVGSSGGIDSALTLALAVQALGAANVTAISMPSEISSEGSKTDSEHLCKNLGVEHKVFRIGELVRQYEATSGFDLEYKPQGLALENLQARIRGMVLMTHSNTFGHLVLTTGNKSEISVGYSTLYGDMNGGLGLIGDLYKTEVYALARHINETAGFDVIPRPILEKEPSAELAPGQKDRDSLPPYDVLDTILKYLIEGNLLQGEEHRQVFEGYRQLSSEQPEMIRRVQQLIARSEYKRRQAPPILRLRSRAFGQGRQIPITAKQYNNEG
jgi:NAD+ synthetase